jgi:hypothetical protein
MTRRRVHSRGRTPARIEPRRSREEGRSDMRTKRRPVTGSTPAGRRRPSWRSDDRGSGHKRHRGRDDLGGPRRHGAALVEDAAALIELTGCEVDLHGGSGDVLKQGDPIPTARGAASALLRSWKVAQTSIEIWSGVASARRRPLIAAAGGVNVENAAAYAAAGADVLVTSSPYLGAFVTCRRGSRGRAHGI